MPIIFKRNKNRKVSKSNLGKTKVKDTKFEEFIYGNVWFRQMEFLKKGARKEGHVHNFDHVHFVVKGKVEVFELISKNGKIIEKSLGILEAPAKIKVPAGTAHTVVALEDNTMALCVQAVRDEDMKILKTNYIDKNRDNDVKFTKL